MINLIFIFCFVIFALLTAIAMIVMGYIFSYKSSDKVKSSTYECGLAPETSAKICFNIRYFNYLILFLIFESALILIYPLCVYSGTYNYFEFIALFLFLSMLLIVVFYSIKRKFIGGK